MSAFRFHVSAVFINFWARKNDTYKGWACEACEAYGFDRLRNREKKIYFFVKRDLKIYFIKCCTTLNKIRKHNFSNKYLCGALVLSSFFCLSGRQKFSFLLVYFICKKGQNTENFGFSGRKNWLPKLSLKHFGNINRPFWLGGLFSCYRPRGIRLVEYFKAKIVSRVTAHGLNWNYKLHTLKW